MTISFIYNGVTLDPDRVRLLGDPNNAEASWTSSANSGGYDTASVIVDDPDGDLDFPTMQSFLVIEDDCAVTRIWTGYVISAVLERGPTYGAGVSRIWTLEMAGINSYPMLRIFDPAVDSPKRPAETSIERIEWLLGTTAVIGGSELFNDAFVDTSDPIDMTEADYDGQRPADVLNDLIGVFVPYNWFIVYNPADDTQGLFYGASDDGISTSTISFTNDLANVDSTTLLMHDDATFTRDGQDINAAVHVKYRGGSFLRRRPSTAIPYTDRHATLSSDRVGLFSTASSWAESFLDMHDEPTEMLEWTADIPATQVNLVREGMVTNVEASHFPAPYDAGSDVVIRRRAVQQYPGRVDLYRVRFQGSVSPIPGSIGGGDPDDFPPTSPCTPESLVVENSGWVEVNESTFVMTLPFTPAVGSTVVLSLGYRVDTDTVTLGPESWNELFPAIDSDGSVPQQYGNSWFSRVWQTGDSDSISVSYLPGGSGHQVGAMCFELSGVGNMDDFGTVNPAAVNPASVTWGTVTPTAGGTYLVLGGGVVNDDVNNSMTWAAVAPSTELIDHFGNSRPPMWAGYRVISNASGSYTVEADLITHGGIIQGYLGAAIAFQCANAGACPASGQVNARPEIVTLTGADGTTACPFADGTLHVFIDNVEQTDTLVSQDGATGDFTLGFDPTPTEVCTVEYLGR